MENTTSRSSARTHSTGHTRCLAATCRAPLISEDHSKTIFRNSAPKRGTRRATAINPIYHNTTSTLQPRTPAISRLPILFVLLASLLFLSGVASATPDLDHGYIPRAIVVDTSEPQQLKPRAVDPTSSSSSGILAPTGTATSNGAATKTSSTSGIATDTSAPVFSGTPRPFDTRLVTTNVTDACGLFFRSFLASNEYRACNPVSMLMRNSDSWLTISRLGSTALTTALAPTCDIDLSTCSTLVSGLATSLIAEKNCGSDYESMNPIVAEAYLGLINFRSIQAATCLKNNETGKYCYVEANTNRQNTGDAAVYFLPFGTGLEDEKPSCSACLKGTMEIFAGYAGKDTKGPLKKTYSEAAKAINADCASANMGVVPTVGVESSTSGGAVVSASLATMLVALGFTMFA